MEHSLVKTPIIREDGYVFDGYMTKKGVRYPVWRSPVSYAKRAEHKRTRYLVANLSEDQAMRLRRSSAQRNALRRAVKGDHIKALNRASYSNSKKTILQKNAAWRKANWSKVLESRRKPQYAMAAKLRSRVIAALKSQKAKKSAATIALVGCEWPVLLAHLEALFLPGMTWENHGQWHIDHKRPCTSFDLTLPDQQRECFHYTNLQPLWAVDNLRKGNRYLEATS